MLPEHNVLGQPSWQIDSDCVHAYLTRQGGHLGPVSFRIGDRQISPFHVAPWHNEEVDGSLPAVLRVLRGDFFCMPFGGNETPFEGEIHPPHGETANDMWHFVGHDVYPDRQTAHFRMMTTVRPGVVDKYITLRNGQTAIYQKHVISGVSGPMSFGHHAMLKFPDRDRSGLISTSPFVWGATPPKPVEEPASRGYSILQHDSGFESLKEVKTTIGTLADLTAYPDRIGYEDLVMIVSDPRAYFGWAAVAFPDAGYVWYSLKSTGTLKQTVFWLSNQGRHYPPWSGRHSHVMGIEEVTSYFHYGLSESVRVNPVSESGYETCVELTPEESYEVPYIMGLAAIDREFGQVERIEVSESADSIRIVGTGGFAVEASVDTHFL